MAQKPRTKSQTTPKLTTDFPNNNQDSPSPTGKTEPAEEDMNANKQSKHNSSKNNLASKEEKENLKKGGAEVTDTNGLSPKPQRHTTRESRILSDPGMRTSGISARNNSYNGPDNCSVKESYASKSSANINSPPTKTKTTGQAATHIKPGNSKSNNPKGHANNKSQKSGKENSAVAVNKNVSTGNEVPVKVVQNNNNKKEEGSSTEEN